MKTTLRGRLAKILWKHMRPTHDGATNNCIDDILEEIQTFIKTNLKKLF